MVSGRGLTKLFRSELHLPAMLANICTIFDSYEEISNLPHFGVCGVVDEGAAVYSVFGVECVRRGTVVNYDSLTDVSL